jgi:hypothetical protein
MVKDVLHVATITYTGRDSRPDCYPKKFVRNGLMSLLFWGRIMAPTPSTAWMLLLELEIKHKHGGFNINYEKATVVWQQFGFGS